ncbi:MAG: hypothetical protein WC374_09390 [Phycisphaerae bacterium]|jgi:hypothetical protein
MKESKRNSRIRALVKCVNSHRKKQAAQIDMLCKDIIASHSNFLDTVRTLSFAAEFYESIIGVRNLEEMFCTCASVIRKQIGDVNLVFFISRQADFQSYAFDCSTNGTEEINRLEQYFTRELIESVTKTNHPCSPDELLGMGLQVSPAILKNLSVITVPIAANGPIVGFILLYVNDGQHLDRHQIKPLSYIRRGLLQGIRTCTVEQPNS